MKDKLQPVIQPMVRYGYILVHDTLWHGVLPAEWDGNNRVVLYETRYDAEAERLDAAEMWADSLNEARMEPEDDDNGLWIEAAVLHTDGSLTLTDQGRTFPAATLRELHR